MQITESSLARLWKKYKEYDSGTISACRGGYTYKENSFRTLKLKTELIKLGYSITSISGTYIENYGEYNAKEVHEKAFIVFDQYGKGNLKKDLMRLGEEYNQDSITYNSVEEQTYYIIGTNKTAVYPGYHNEIALGKPMFGKNGEAYSKVHGRPFVFEEYDNSHYEFDCTRLSYSMSTIFMLKYNDTFILTQ